MSNSPEPRDVVRRFLEHGRGPDGWNMEVIEECFDDRYWSHTWQGDLAHTGARQGRFFAAIEFVAQLWQPFVHRGSLLRRETARVLFELADAALDHEIGCAHHRRLLHQPGDNLRRHGFQVVEAITRQAGASTMAGVLATA